jgi:hypothetical protein
MVVEPLAERGVGGDLGIPDAQVRVGRVIPEAVLPRATLDQRDPLTAEALISEESCGGSLAVRACQNRRECHSILYRLAGALSQVGKHRVRRVAKKGQAASGPDWQRLTVIQSPSERRLYPLQQRSDARIPARELLVKDVGVAGSRPRFLGLFVRRYESDVVDELPGAHGKRENEALRQPEIQDSLRKLSAEVFGGSGEKASRYMRDEIDRWGKVIKAADIKLQ